MYGLLAWWDGFPPHEACSFSNNTEAHRTLFCQAQQNGCHPMYTNNLEEPDYKVPELGKAKSIKLNASHAIN